MRLSSHSAQQVSLPAPTGQGKAPLRHVSEPSPTLSVDATPLCITGKHIMIRKLLFAAAAAFVGKKLMDRNRDNKSMNGTGSQRATDRGNRSASYTGSTGGAAEIGRAHV